MQFAATEDRADEAEGSLNSSGPRLFIDLSCVKANRSLGDLGRFCLCGDSNSQQQATLVNVPVARGPKL